MISLSVGAWSVLAILALGGIAAWVTRMLVLEGKFLPNLRTLIAMIAAPADYFTPLQRAPLSVSREGSRTTMKVRHKYAGRHVIEMAVSKRFTQGVVPYRATLRLVLDFNVDGRPALRRSVDDATSPWWTHSSNGFVLTRYWVPDDAPLRHEVELVATIEKADPQFELEYGDTTILVRKDLEK